jgi:IS30 family transposase
LIDQRPAVVEDRIRIGDREGDLITGRANRSAIGTLVDRTSRYVRLIHLPDGHRAHHLQAGLVGTMGDLPSQARRSLTWDQGSEMACHDQLADCSSTAWRQVVQVWGRGPTR